MKSFSHVLKDIWKRRLVRLATILLALVVMVVLLTPIALRFAATSWLTRNGAETASIETLSINPFTGTLHLTGVSAWQDGREVISGDDLFIDVDVQDLFSRHVVIEQLDLNGVSVEVERFMDGGLRIGSYRPVAAPETVPEPAETAQPWYVTIISVSLDKVLIDYTMPKLSGQVQLNHADGANITTDPDASPGSLSLTATVNKAPISLVLTTVGISRGIQLAGAVRIEDLSLGNAEKIVQPVMQSMQGTLRADGALIVTLGEDGLLTEFDGQLGLFSTALASESFSLAGSYDWQGTLSYQITPEITPVVAVNGILTAAQPEFALAATTSIQAQTISLQAEGEVQLLPAIQIETAATLTYTGLDFRGADLGLQGASGGWQGRIGYGAQENRLAVAIEGKTEFAHFIQGNMDAPTLDVREFSVEGIATIAKKETFTGSFYGALTVAESGLAQPSNQLELTEIDWIGMLFVQTGDDQTPTQLKANGTLAAGNISFAQADQLALSQDKIVIDGNASFTSGDDMAASYQGEISLANTSVSSPQLTISGEESGWGGSIELAGNTDNGIIEVNTDGVLSATTFSFGQSDTQMSQQSLMLNGAAGITVGDGLAASYQGKISLAGTSLFSDRLAIAGQTAEWDGELSFAQDPAAAMTAGGQGTLKMSDVSIDQGLELNINQQAVTQLSQQSLTLNGAAGITVGDGLAASYQGKISLAGTSIVSDRLAIAGQTAEWDGELSFAQDPAAAMTAGGQGTLKMSDVSFDQGLKLSIAQQAVEISGIGSLKQSDALEITYDGTVDLDGSRIESDTFSLTGTRTGWSGVVNYQQHGETPTIGVNGSLSAHEHTVAVAAADLSVGFDELSIGTDTRLTPTLMEASSGSMDLTLDGLSVAKNESEIITVAEIELDSLTTEPAGKPRLTSLTVADITLPPSTLQPHTISLAEYKIEDADIGWDMQALSARRQQINGLEFTPENGESRLAISAVTLAQAALSERFTHVEIDSISGEEMSWTKTGQPPDTPPDYSLGTIAVSDVVWQPESGTKIQLIHATDLFGRLARAPSQAPPSGTTEPSVKSPPTPPEAADVGAGEDTKATPSKAIALAIESVLVDGASGISFIDTTLATPFTATIEIVEARASKIDFNQPEIPFEFSIDAIVDTYAPLTISGTTAPLATEYLVTKTTRLRNYSLPKLSPYGAETIGTLFDAGRLSLTSSVTIVGSEVDSENTLTLKEIKTKSAQNEQAKAFRSKLPVPLETALYMLADSDGTITLDFPISGNRNDIDVGIGDVLGTALSKAITVAVTPYLAYTVLGPTGALAYLGVQVGRGLLDTDLPSLSFETGQTELAEKQIETLDSIGKTLAKRFTGDAQETISICATVGSEELGRHETSSLTDRQLGKALFELGETRALTVRDYLAATHAIAESRMLICSPRIDFKKNTSGRIEFKE
jgi:hypothetical protein